ncbi:MAG: N-acetyl-gamma-glutamyl-phosphate reductase [Hyphomicrobiaceae bacterium hypho_1]
MSCTPTIFIDGEAGTTGLKIREHLREMPGVSLRAIPQNDRKNPLAKKALLKEVDMVVLCLPDKAARKTVEICSTLPEGGPKIVDTSTVHRVSEGWVYGFPELNNEQEEAIKKAKWLSNPGCYPTGVIALLRPLIDAGIIQTSYPITINAISGYSGGGKSMIHFYEEDTAPPFEMYSLGLRHKHLPELQKYTMLKHPPIFIPSVGNFRQGMLISIPLHLNILEVKTSFKEIYNTLANHYVGRKYVKVVSPMNDKEILSGKISPELLNNTNNLELRVFNYEKYNHVVLIARLDNLGKGASGAAVQNIKLMLGLDD